MKQDPHSNIEHMHHTARWFPGPERWVIINRSREPVAVIATNTANHVTELTITLVLGEHKLSPRSLMRPGGMRTALRWLMIRLNNDNLWLSARLSLERKARFLGYDEPRLLDCWHATDYMYCLRLLADLPGLSDWELA